MRNFRLRSVAVLWAIVFLCPGGATAQDGNVTPVRLPALWGSDEVGVRTMVVEDTTRVARSGDGREVPRPILIRIWHPAVMIDEDRSRAYMDPAVADAWRSTLPVPAGWERGVVTNAAAEAPLVRRDAPWPVLLFSHGRSFPVGNYQILLEQLASRGWIMVGISHVGEEVLTRLPDGTVFEFTGPGWEREEDRGEVLMGVVDELVRDATRVLDALETLNASSTDPWAGRLDLSGGVGYLGHSLGGAVAAWTLQRDDRVSAAVSWEGQVYREQDRPLVPAGPLLYVIGGANRGELAGHHFESAGPARPVYEAVVHGAWHASVGDLLHIYRPYAPRDWKERHRREITAERTNQITADLVNAFFERYLLGMGGGLLEPDATSEAFERQQYPEVELRMHMGGGGFWTASPNGR